MPIKKHFSVMEYLIFSLILPLVSLYGDAHVNGQVTDAVSGAAIPDVNIVTIESSDLQIDFSLGIPGNITGQVIESMTNLPLAHAIVDIMRGNKIISSVLTDENGIYNVYELAPKPYIIRVRMPDFQFGLQLGVPISGKTIVLNFALQHPPGEITGQVINRNTGLPVADAVIDIVYEGAIIDSIQSDENGNYTFSKITPNHYEMKVTSFDFYPLSQFISLSTHQTLMTNFTLDPLGSIIGYVLHAFTSQPIVGAVVGMWQNDALFASTSTDVNGYFSFKGGQGNYQLVVQARNFYTLEQEGQILRGQASTINFNLVCFEPKSPKRVHGRVIKKVIAHQINFIHRITWEASRDPSVTSYHLYCDNKYVGKFAAHDPFQVDLPWRNKETKTYQLKAVNAFGQESMPLSIHLPPK